MLSATTLLASYAGKLGEKADMTVRDFVNQVVTLCPKPTFIRVLPEHFSHKWPPKERKRYALRAFVLSHAVQILLFAPQDRIPNRIYSRDGPHYAHRFPSPDNIGGGIEKNVAGLFSMEDLHRAILLFYFMINRRMDEIGRPWIGKVHKYEASPNDIQFPGYYTPDADADPTSADPQPQNHSEPVRTEAPVHTEAPVLTESPVLTEGESISEGLGHGVSVTEPSEDTSPITGLEAVDINTKILESIVTTCPARTIPESLKILDEPEPRRLLPRGFRELVVNLKRHHQQPDFDARLARYRDTVTYMSFEKHPATIIVEECNFSQKWPLHLQSAIEQQTKEHYLAQQKSEGFDEQRKGMLVSFDWRNCAILNLDDAKTFRHGVAEARKTVHLLQTIYRLQGIENAATTLKLDSAGVDHVRMLTSCGLQLLYRQFKGDKERIVFPKDRSASLRWLCQYSPIMTRALDLAIENVGKQLLIYVDDPWIQW
jgi:hypothetical protein